MKLLLTLLALLTGFAGADRAVAQPVASSASAAIVALADVAAQRVAVAPAHRPVAAIPACADSMACTDEPGELGLFRPGVLIGIDRARE